MPCSQISWRFASFIPDLMSSPRCLQHIYQSLCTMISLILNSVLIYLILYKSPKKLGDYKWLMIYTAVFEQIYTVVDLLTEPTAYSYGYSFVVFRRYNATWTDSNKSQVLIVTWCGLFGSSMAVFGVHFVYRFASVHPKNITKTLYNLNIEDISYISAVFYVDDPNNGSIHLSWGSWIALVQFSTMVGSSMFCVSFLGYLCYSELSSQLSMTSSQSQVANSLKKQLYFALVGQTVIPITFMYLPVCVFVFGPVFMVEIGVISTYLTHAVTLYPVLNPLPNMFIIKSYRNTIIEKRPLRDEYLPDYRYPLGRFKSSYPFANIREAIPRVIERGPLGCGWFQKMNISWTHGIVIPDPHDMLTLYVQCKLVDEPATPWKIEAEVSISLHNYNDPEAPLNYDLGIRTFQNNFRSARHDNVMNINDLLDENFGFVKNNEIRVESDIRILTVEGFYQPRVIDYRVPPPEKQNHILAFEYEDAKLYVHKAILSFHLQYPDYIYSTNSFPIKRLSSGCLEQYLDALYGFPIYIHARQTVKDILSVARTFITHAISQRAAPAIIYDSMGQDIPKNHVELAVEFDLRRVIHAWLSKMDSVRKEDVEGLNIEEMSGEVMKAIVRKVINSGWEKN
ncbi:hypothetical protein L3Y34_002914 [Caenorhabditis briggsae]|uniref:MATH domain-containing protein n=1 Tax=Caenorhabditis briggsae TaxID=6238 RepID=A0AAE9AE92_CAEBR|nr:hypothetical protein L3Y34_002914 [Caenorhabditis briggsae]